MTGQLHRFQLYSFINNVPGYRIQTGSRLIPHNINYLQLLCSANMYSEAFRCRWSLFVPHNVPLLSAKSKCLGTFLHNTLYLKCQIKAYCPIQLWPFSEMFQTMLWQVQLLCSNGSDNWLLLSTDEDTLEHNDPNSLYSCVWAQSSPSSTSKDIYTTLMIVHCFTTSEIPFFNALIFSSDPKDRIMPSVWIWLLAWHVNQLECFVFYRCLDSICSKLSTCSWLA